MHSPRRLRDLVRPCSTPPAMYNTNTFTAKKARCQCLTSTTRLFKSSVLNRHQGAVLIVYNDVLYFTDCVSKCPWLPNVDRSLAYPAIGFLFSAHFNCAKSQSPEAFTGKIFGAGSFVVTTAGSPSMHFTFQGSGYQVCLLQLAGDNTQRLRQPDPRPTTIPGSGRSQHEKEPNRRAGWQDPAQIGFVATSRPARTPLPAAGRSHQGNGTKDHRLRRLQAACTAFSVADSRGVRSVHPPRFLGLGDAIVV